MDSNCGLPTVLYHPTMSTSSDISKTFGLTAAKVQEIFARIAATGLSCRQMSEQQTALSIDLRKQKNLTTLPHRPAGR